MKSEKLQFDRSLATDSEATYRLRTKSHHSLDAGIGGTFYSIPVDSYRNFRRILLYAAMRTISGVMGQQQPAAGGQSVIDLKSTYCFCAHMHEIMKYFLLTENQ